MAPTIFARLTAASLLAIALVAPARAATHSVDVLAVTASSTDGMLMDAVDGDPTTAWQARAGVRQAWLAVRLEHPAALSGVSLQTGPMPAGETFAIETSQDGTHYTTQLHGAHIQTDQPVVFALKAGALYVRVRFEYAGSGAPPRFRIQELEALSAD